MPGDCLPPIESPDGAYVVTWSRDPLPGSDVVVYFNHFAYRRRLHERVCPKARKILYMYEPVAVDPVQYTRRVWRKFDHCVTWNTWLTGQSSHFAFDAGAYYDLPYCFDYGITPLTELAGALKGRENAICQLCGDKYSLAPEELYSKRRKIALWFSRHGKLRMDVFGRPAMAVPNYIGESSDKLATLRKYRYALCFENSYHPVWTEGYATEKILDCMAALTIPVYLGASNIEALFPRDCFIDYRDFDSPAALEQHLLNLSDADHQAYVENMLNFMKEYDARERHSITRLYETVVQLYQFPDSPEAADLPADYSALASPNARIRLWAAQMLLPLYPAIYPMFSILRGVRKWFS